MFSQLLALWLITWAISHFLLAWVVPNVPAGHRTVAWTKAMGIVLMKMPAKALLSSMVVISYWLWVTNPF